MTTQTVVVEMFLSGAWTAVPLYSAAGTTIERSADFPTATKLSCELNNDSYAYDPSRPESVLYGVAGRNTKTRVIVNGHTRVHTEASEWKPELTGEHSPGARGRSWTKLTAEGVLRRLGRWSDPLRSPMYRTISGRSTSIGHWPLEEERDASQASATAGRPAAVNGGVEFGDAEAPQGAARTARIKNGSLITGQFDGASTTAGWQAAFSMKLPAVPVGATYTGLLNFSTSNGYRWFWNVNDVSYQLEVIDDTGASVYAGTVLFGAGAEPNQWVTFRLKATVSGGTVTVEPAWYAQNGITYGTTGTFAGTVGALRSFRQVGSAVNDGGWVSHIFGVTGGATDLLGFEALRSFDGYLGETAGDRFLRLCTQVGITRYMIGSASATEAMGPQRADTFIALLSEIVATDDCIIYDERFDIALTMRTRRSMLSQTAVLALTYPAQIAPPLTKIIDDEGTHNRVTAKNVNGGEFTASELTGPMSVQVPPAGVGEYKQTVEVNVANEGAQLEPLAGWALSKGTIARTRYATVTVDLLEHPELIGSVMGVNLGDLITITGKEADPIPLRVVGITDAVGSATWTWTARTEPYEAWAAGRYDAAAYRYDVAGSTVAGALAAAGARNLNPFFEGGLALTDWTPFGSSSYDLTGFLPHEGAFCSKITPTGAAATTRVECGAVSGATPGQSWRGDAWIKVEAARNCTANINWFDSSGGYLSTSNGAATPVVAFSWTPITVTGVAPASAAKASLSLDMGGTPPATHIMYIDEAVIRPTAAATLALTGVTSSDVWSTSSLPYDLMIAGERVLVTGMTAAAGAGPYTQTATVVRAVNGVVKAHVVGEEVHIATPGRYAL